MNNRQIKKRRNKLIKCRNLLANSSLPTFTMAHSFYMYGDWFWPGCGFGQIDFIFDEEKNTLTCSNECMSRNSVRKILHAFADFIADRAILICPGSAGEDDCIPLKPMPQYDVEED